MIKLIAYLAMTVDHIAHVYSFDNIIMLYIGRIAFPLFAWSIAMGSKRTSNFNSYLTRLLTIAIISQIPYWLLFKNTYLNVCFTLFIGLFILKVYNNKKNKIAKWSYIILLILISDIVTVEYGLYGVLTILVFYFYNERVYRIMPTLAIVTILGVEIYGYSTIQYISLFSVFIILVFQKFNFKLNKIMQYSYYPLHLTLLLIL